MTCSSALSANSSLPQGEAFAKMTSSFHGGRSTRRHRMRGGALASMGAPFANAFDNLPTDMRDVAGLGKIDAAFNQLPEFAGKYGMAGGRRSTRRHRMRGGVADLAASDMILTPAEAAQAGLHPQWVNENLVVPSFKSPDSVLVQKAGKRKSKKASRKDRKSKKVSRKDRKSKKASRKSSRKHRKDRK